MDTAQNPAPPAPNYRIMAAIMGDDSVTPALIHEGYWETGLAANAAAQAFQQSNTPNPKDGDVIYYALKVA